MKSKKAAFWIAVGGVSIISPFLLELAADRLPFEGLKRFVAYIHRGPTSNGGQ